MVFALLRPLVKRSNVDRSMPLPLIRPASLNPIMRTAPAHCYDAHLNLLR